MSAAADAVHATPNGVHDVLTPAADNGALSSAPDSPAVASPESPAAAPAVKIDVDYLQRESDARHEPVAFSLEKLDDVSTLPQLGTPVDPGTDADVLPCCARSTG